MRLRSVLIIGLLVLLFVAGVTGFINFLIKTRARPPQVVESDRVVNQEQLLEEESLDPTKVFIKDLELRKFAAAAGDLSLCSNDAGCLKDAKRIKAGVCATKVCDGKGAGKRINDCFVDVFDPVTKEDPELDAIMCALMKSPGFETRRTLMAHIPGSREEDIVKHIAFIYASKGSGGLCEKQIKDFLGPFGPQWDFLSYSALSGCRILAHQRTHEEEEKDFYTWLGVVDGLGDCSGIVNSDMRKACNTPGANLKTKPAIYDQ
ncbi:MAG: hypothetical protein Q8Q08_05130 [Candidatus Omnitrophota bacterium]|nr:hypothetical protein [Candidatus Omnitrophota bacterium]